MLDLFVLVKFTVFFILSCRFQTSCLGHTSYSQFLPFSVVYLEEDSVIFDSKRHTTDMLASGLASHSPPKSYSTPPLRWYPQ